MRKRSGVVSIVAIAVLPALGGCDRGPDPAAVGAPDQSVPSAAAPPGSTAPTPSLGTRIDDTAITARVKAAFVADPDVKSLDIAVETRKGVVQLSGFVDSQAQVERAVDVARRTEGVSEVQNKLALKTPGSVGSAVDDALVTAKVKTALLRDDAVKGLDISVHTDQGQVQLSGYVENEAQVRRATELARTVDGVKAVDNKMSLKH